jgi:hypothetical protein
LIPKGTVAWVQDELDLVLDPGFVQGLDEVRRAMVLEYAFRDARGRYVYCWDLGRFINHSFHANLIGTAYDFEVAVRDIQPGEQLTDDYGTLNLEQPFDCRPEAGTDRTQALPDDLLRYAERWDRQALEALREFDRVPQPLAPLIDPRFHDAVRTAVEQGILLDSIATTACEPLAAPQARARQMS